MSKGASEAKKRAVLYEQQGGRCYFCDKELAPLDSLIAGTRHLHNYPTLEHKVLRCEGGTKAWTNLVVTCDRCNGIRGMIPFETFIEQKLYLPENTNKARKLDRDLQIAYNAKVLANRQIAAE